MSKAKRKHVNLRRLIRHSENRGYEFSVLRDAHVPGLYAGYRKGAFDEEDKIPKDLQPREFPAVLEEISVYSMLYTFTDVDDRPLVLLVLFPGRVPEVHAFWMPWASGRDKVALGVRFFGGLAKTQKALTVSNEDNQPYFDHLCKYGILRKVGRIDQAFGEEVGTMYQAMLVDTSWLPELKLETSDNE